MKKQWLLVAAIAAMTAALPMTAIASVVGTAHDIPNKYAYTGTDAKQGTCSFCHVPHKAQSGGQKLFPVAVNTDALNAWGSQDPLSQICWYCHGAASGYTSAREVNPFNASAHKRTVGTLSGYGGGEAVPADVKLATGDNNLACVSCHSIHDNSKRPFMAWGTAGNYSADATGNIGFCAKCHSARNNTGSIGTANPGNHPSMTAMTDNGSNSPLVGTVLPAVMQVDLANMTDYAATAASWNLGGHALSAGATETATTFVCASCHTVHMNETTVWTAADGATTVTSPITPAGNNITVLDNAPKNVAGSNEDICVACHSVAAVRGPGASGTGSHPFNTESAVASAVVTGARGYRWGTATNSVIQCQSCHDIHWSALGHTGTTAVAGDYLLAYACADCHSVSGTDVGYTNHHPTNIANADTKVRSSAVASSATDWTAKTQTTTATSYFPTANKTMTCETCHGLGNAKAHNNAGGSFPGLTGIITESDMCVDCHDFNPSLYTANNGTGASTHTSTHFVGNITTTTYKKTDTFISGATNNVAKYSADGTNGSIICESCHTLKMNGKNSHVITYATADNTGDGQAATSNSVRLLLQVSGNTRTVATSADSLCTECHGSAPGAGVTHPVEPGYTTDASAKITTAGMAPASLTGGTSGKIVCESCHRPHDAATPSANWILEDATAGTGYTDYSSLCSHCHSQGQ